MARTSPLLAVVDDDAEVRTAIVRLLASVGYAVEAYASGDEFLSAIRIRQPDCLLLDLHMPGTSGFDVARSLVSAYPTLPVVIVTVDDSEESQIRAGQFGARRYLCKPVDGEALIEAVGAALQDDGAPDAA
jgi:FixJ family two-component response regulator